MDEKTITITIDVPQDLEVSFYQKIDGNKIRIIPQDIEVPDEEVPDEDAPNLH